MVKSSGSDRTTAFIGEPHSSWVNDVVGLKNKGRMRVFFKIIIIKNNRYIYIYIYNPSIYIYL